MLRNQARTLRTSFSIVRYAYIHTRVNRDYEVVPHKTGAPSRACYTTE